MCSNCCEGPIAIFACNIRQPWECWLHDGWHIEEGWRSLWLLSCLHRHRKALFWTASQVFYQVSNTTHFLCNTSDRVVFSIMKGSTVQSIDGSYLHGTVAELFGHAKSKSLLSESDTKSLKIPLRLFVYPKSLTHIEVAHRDTCRAWVASWLTDISLILIRMMGLLYPGQWIGRWIPQQKWENAHQPHLVPNFLGIAACV